MLQSDKSTTMLHAMIGLGFPASLAGMLFDMQADMTGIPTLTSAEHRWLSGPIIVHNGSWGIDETHPVHKLKGQIYQERFDGVLRRSKLMVGPSEICAVMYCATMESPLNHPMPEIYIWASCHAMGKQTGTDPAKIHEMVRISPQETLLGLEEILEDPRYAMAYHGIAGEIRRKVENAAPREGRRTKADAPIAADPIAAEPLQASFF